MLSDPTFLAAAVAAVMIAGVSKGGFGSGLGMAAVPLMALVVTPVQAAAIMLPILCAMDLMNLRAYWGRWDWRELMALVPPSMIGIAIGALLFRYLSDDVLRLLIGLIAILFTLNHWLRPSARGKAGGYSRGRAGLWGAVAGFTSFAAHAGGPPLNMYLLPRRLQRTVYQATTVMFFTAVNAVKLVPYWFLGLFPQTNLVTSAALVPVAALGIWLGVYLHRRVSDGLFYRLAYLFLFATGLKLAWDGVTGLL